ncbi:MAG: EAL domain-containing protein, partial [Pseudomonadota bacterium]
MGNEVHIEAMLKGALNDALSPQSRGDSAGTSANEPNGEVVTFPNGVPVIAQQRLVYVGPETVTPQADYTSTLEHVAIGIAHISNNGRFSYVNRKLCEILGYSRDELIGMVVDSLSHDDDKGMVSKRRRAQRDSGDNSEIVRVEKRYRRKNGDVIWVRLTVTDMSAHTGGDYDISVVEDITARVKAEEDFKYFATHDELTALPNRMLFTHLLRHSLDVGRRYSRQVAVLLIDLDRFKHIIDSLGHAAGDYVLQEMGQRFKETVRSSDLVARLGGDEFVILLQEVTSEEQVAIVARKILEKAMEPIKLIEHECRITASIGISLYPQDGDTDMDIMRHADQALYLAKGDGRNNYQFCPPEADGAGTGKIQMETLLHHALDNNELSLNYQAKVEVPTGRVVGAEALLRWHSPVLGHVSPAQFVPLAEELELIFPIGRWVIAEACAQMKRWRDAKRSIQTISVNLSPRQFADPDLISFISKTLHDLALPGHVLELEITEGVVMHKPEKALLILRAIKELGVKIAIDDFGTGYSSLGQLKRFPVDTLKIDRSFIKEIEHDKDDKALTRAIITMGKMLGLSVVAEGVETAGQAAFLAEHGCR